MKLFAELPPHCVTLLDDMDAAGMVRRDESTTRTRTRARACAAGCASTKRCKHEKVHSVYKPKTF